MRNSVLAATALVAALGMTPALAQTTTGTAASGSANAQTTPPAATSSTAATATKPERGTATINPTGIPPSQRNPLLADNGDVRIGKAIGTDVYNKDDKNLGSVDDVLVAKDGKLNAVISTSGKLVLVPWDKLQFGDAKLNGDNKILLPDATKASLKSMTAFNYKNQPPKAAPAPSSASTANSSAAMTPAVSSAPKK